MLKTFAVIGDPIDHSMSPNIHNAAFRELGMDATYIAYRIPVGELGDGVRSLKNISVSGFNVTIPHKIGMMEFLDKMDESCSAIGAANTVANDGGTLKGYNTDMDGFLDPIKRRQIGIRGQSVLLLGSGGAARAIVAGFAREGAAEITILGRSMPKAMELAEFASRLGLEARSSTIEQMRADPSRLSGTGPASHKFVVNATPIGLRGEPTPIEEAQISGDSVVYDIVYMPMNTDLLRKARAAGATTIFGYEMLLGQAARSFEIWHHREAPYEVMRRALVGAGGAGRQ